MLFFLERLSKYSSKAAIKWISGLPAFIWARKHVRSHRALTGFDKSCMYLCGSCETYQDVLYFLIAAHLASG